MNEISPSQPAQKTPKVLFLIGGGCASLAMFAFCVILLVVVLPANRAAREEARKEEALVYTEQGDTYFYEEHDYRAALEAYQKAVDLDPENVTAYVGIGNVYDTEGDFSKALKFYNQALSLDTSSNYAYYHRGIAYLGQGQYANATEDFKNAEKLGTRNSWLYYFRGVSEDELGNFDTAFEYYEQYLTLDAEDNNKTRYACERVNSITFWHSDNLGEMFFSAIFQPCTRFPAVVESTPEEFGSYQYEEEDYYSPMPDWRYYNSATGQYQNQNCSTCSPEAIP